MKLQNLKFALRADSGLALGTIYPLYSARSILGRSVDLAVPVDDAKVSRIHAAVDQQNGFYYVVDLGSTNGTFLNGRRLESALRLSVGDQIRVGNATFRVELLDQAKGAVGRTWKEATKAVLKADVAEKPTQVARSRSSEPTPPSARSVRSATQWLESFVAEKKTAVFEGGYGRWLSIGVSLVLIAAAVVSSFRH